MRALADRITRLPLLPEGRAPADDFAKLCAGAAGASPYLGHLLHRHGEWIAEAAAKPPEEALTTLLDETDARLEADPSDAGAVLRQAKSRAALLIALADLGGAWDLTEVIHALSDLADRLLARAVRLLLRAELATGKLPGLTPADLETGAGYVVIAMGKHGARELNYSSDIDLICLFDQSRFEPDTFAEVKARFIRLTRNLVKFLSEPTGAGYVFRTDLRLRPSPSTTPVCLAMEAAERYYESVGRTWERAAHIKARPVAGDIEAGRAYLARLRPFVWRRYLDFAAIEDTHGILQKIRETKGTFATEALAGTDIKQAPGGIREIEFFAQTRQLIQGGRMPELREPTSLGALAALARAEIIPGETAEALSADYIAHRTLEHRLQMIEDAQTHTVPSGEEGRRRVAALMGAPDQAAWEAEISARLHRVHTTVARFFEPDQGPTAAPAPTAPQDSDLAALGFTRPEDSLATLSRWRRGAIPATRDGRAQRLYAGLEPRILRKLAEAGDPDAALIQFDRFLGGLPAGVQLFSLFNANPHLLDLIVRICALAPRLAGYLGRQPQVLDALLEPDFFQPLPDLAELRQTLAAQTDPLDDYERVLDTARRSARELTFQAGVQLLVGMASADETGRAFSTIAEATIQVLTPRVVAEFSRRHGPPPGRGLAVIAMGKLGSGEMTASSDLDLITVFDPGTAESSTGPKPLAVSAYYPRLTQALVSALTVPTAEGRLYEVDMRLRPSGRQGPVAVSLDGFRRYQNEQAWVWEHMALTRARAIAGDPSLLAEIEGVITETLLARRGDPAVLTEGAEMRHRLLQATRGEVWDVKAPPGGLMEVEFIAQAGSLHAGCLGCRRADKALPKLAEAGWLTKDEAHHLAIALMLYRQIQQIERAALETALNPEAIGPGLKSRLLATSDRRDIDDLAHQISQHRAKVTAIAERIFKQSPT